MKRRKRDVRDDEWPKKLRSPKKKKGESTNVHHRKTRWLGGRDVEENRSVVSVREHHAFNLMFNDGHMSAPEIARKLTSVWLDPEWELVARKRNTHEEVQSEVVTFKEHDCSTCDNHKLRELLNPMMKVMAQEAVARAFH